MASYKNKKNRVWLRIPSKFESVVVTFVLITSVWATYQFEMALREKKQIIVEQELFIEKINHANAALALWREHLIEREYIVELREQKLDDSKKVINYKIADGMIRL